MIGVSDSNKINDIIKFNKTLIELHILNNSFFIIDTEKFKFNNTLTKIIFNCQIDDILKINTTLKEIYTNTIIDYETIQLFLNVLNINKTLEKIYFKNSCLKIDKKLQENKYYREIIKPRIEQENFYLNLFLTKSIIKIPNLVRDEFGNFLHTI